MRPPRPHYWRSIEWLAVGMCVGLPVLVAVPFLLSLLLSALGQSVSDYGNATDASVASTKSQAETIVTALAAYKRDNGRYPAKLDELVPKYLPSIEHPLLGDSWMYAAPPDGYRYSLGFSPGGSDTRSFYWSVEQSAWEMDDGKF